MEKTALTPERFAELLSAERGLTSVLGELDNAEKCGIDCKQKREVLRQQLETISNLKQYFAPQP